MALKFSLRTDAWDSFPGVCLDNVIVCEADEVPVRIPGFSPLPHAIVDSFYSHPLTADGGSGDYTWSITSGLNHERLEIDPVTGELRGTPASVDTGQVVLTVRVEDAHNPSNFAADDSLVELSLSLADH